MSDGQCATPTCDRRVSDAEFCAPCMQSMDYGAGACHNMVHPCDHHRKTYGAYLDGKRDATTRIIGKVKAVGELECCDPHHHPTWCHGCSAREDTIDLILAAIQEDA